MATADDKVCKHSHISSTLAAF